MILRSPHMNNEEPIEMSHYPDGKKEEKTAPIERDDFPAPPFLYADEVYKLRPFAGAASFLWFEEEFGECVSQARKRRWSEPMRKDEEAVDIEPPQV